MIRNNAGPRNAWYRPHEQHRNQIEDVTGENTNNNKNCIVNDETDKDGKSEDNPSPINIVENWIKDATKALLHSPGAALSHVTGSALHLANAAFRLSILPITVPLHVTTRVTQGTIFLIVNGVENVACHVVNIHGAVAVTIGAVVEGIGGVVSRVFFWDGDGEEEEGVVCLEETDVSDDSSDDEMVLVDDEVEVYSVASEGADAREICHTLSNELPLGDNKIVVAVESKKIERVLGKSCTVIEKECVPVAYLRVCDLYYLHDQEKDGDTYRELELYQTLNNSLDDRLSRTLDALTKEAFEMTMDDDHTAQNPRRRAKTIKWKPENDTRKQLKRLYGSTNDDEARIKVLQDTVLVWSGKFIKGAKAAKRAPSVAAQFYGHDVPLFKGKGIVNTSPSDLTKLLLDSDRVLEYSKYSQGRKDVVILQSGERLFDDYGNTIISTPHQNEATKIVKSETKLPFTNVTISLTTFVHTVRLEDNCGYMIVSRSVTEEKNLSSSSNDILWGINLLRSVAGYPNKTELISVNQGKSDLVPKFLSQRVGLKGLVDFYQNVRGASPEN